MHRGSALQQQYVQPSPDSFRSFSGFLHLRSLSILNIDHLSIVPEIQQCIRICARTLSHLRLSMLAQPSKVDPATNLMHLQMSSLTSFNSVLNLLSLPDLSSSSSSSGSQNNSGQHTPQAKLERNTALAYILGVKPYNTENQSATQAYMTMAQDGQSGGNGQGVPGAAGEGPGGSDMPKSDRGKTAEPLVEQCCLFSSSIYALQTALVDLNSSADNNTSWVDQKEILNQISCLVDEYVGPSEPASMPGLHADQEASKPAACQFMTAHLQKLNELSVLLDNRLTSREPSSRTHTRFCIMMQKEIWRLRKKLDNAAAGPAVSGADHSDNTKKGVLNLNTGQWPATTAAADYSRSTHGLALKSFSCQHIPVQAAVFYKGLNLTCLRDLTLFSVGPQAAIWYMLLAENAVCSLPLSSVRTDNVTRSCLECLGSLATLEKLYLLRRDSRNSVAEKVSMRDIRELVLGVHAPRLKVVYISNQESKDWDLGDETLRLLARCGKNIRELACCMEASTEFTLTRTLAKFDSLQALHILKLHAENTQMQATNRMKNSFIKMLTRRRRLRLRYLVLGSTTVYQVERERAENQAAQLTREHDSGMSDGATDEGESDSESSDDEMEDSPSVVTISLRPRHIDTVPPMSIFQKTIRKWVV